MSLGLLLTQDNLKKIPKSLVTKKIPLVGYCKTVMNNIETETRGTP
jgi:hypothetical protein